VGTRSSLSDNHPSLTCESCRPVDDVIIADSGELPVELEVDAEGQQIPVR
jgi:hypothetical protein